MTDQLPSVPTPHPPPGAVRLERRSIRDELSYLIALCADKGGLLDHLETTFAVHLELNVAEAARNGFERARDAAMNQFRVLVCAPDEIPEQLRAMAEDWCIEELRDVKERIRALEFDPKQSTKEG